MNLKLQKRPIPFRYPGGKYYALNMLAPYWCYCPHDEYREPFVGGGSVFFSKNKTKHNIINDIDSELITTYKMMQNPQTRKALVSLLTNEIASKERWREVLEFIPANDLEVAFKYYYLNRTSFSGKLISPAWGYREHRSLPPERWHERIIPCGEKLEGVEIQNYDFEKIINLPARGKSVLMFVDPPYFRPLKKKHYRYGFEPEDHVRLARVLKQTPHKFFLTYEDTPEVRDLYSWAYINDLNFSYRVGDSTTNGGKRLRGTELIISNYKLPCHNLFENE